MDYIYNKLYKSDRILQVPYMQFCFNCSHQAYEANGYSIVFLDPETLDMNNGPQFLL